MDIDPPDGISTLRKMSSSDEDALFAQFIQSPSPVSTTVASDYSGDTLATSGDDPAKGESGQANGEDPAVCMVKPRIRLRVNAMSGTTSELSSEQANFATKAGLPKKPNSSKKTSGAPPHTRKEVQRKQTRAKNAPAKEVEKSRRTSKRYKSQVSSGKLKITLRIN